MARARLTDAEEAELVDELARALEAVVDTSGCRDMLSLYLLATQQPRREFLADDPWGRSAPPLSPRLAGMVKGSRSKYGALAAWRHAVLWREVRDRVDPHFCEAMDVLYFGPYAENAPPYAWTRRSSEAPGADRFSGPNELDRFAREGCWSTVQVLREVARSGGGSVRDEARRAFVRAGVKRSLRDVLRLEEQWEDDSDD
ncbi:hypothetical protein L6R53_05115 [Myxococcota bacterium]|nr:hypothetical protein [Myxococcota bacterium]